LGRQRQAVADIRLSGGRLEVVERVVILGRGGAGKSALARELGSTLGVPVIELDKEFWNDRLEPPPPLEWLHQQTALAQQSSWIMDGDLGANDDVVPRLKRADTVLVLDMPLWVCAWRTWRRGPERRDFWDWTFRWRRDCRPRLVRSIAEHAPTAEVVVLKGPRSIRRWLDHVRP